MISYIPKIPVIPDFEIPKITVIPDSYIPRITVIPDPYIPRITAIPDAVPDRSFIFTRPISSEEDYSAKFRYLAKNYKFSGMSLEELCHHNAKVKFLGYFSPF